MKLSDLFSFGDRYSSVTVQMERTREWEWAEPGGLREGQMLLTGDYRGAEFPLEFRHYSGKRYDDVLGIGYPSLYLVSDRFREVLEKNNFTGWKCFPVRLFTKKGEEVTGYQGFSVTGRAGSVDWGKSEIVYTDTPNGIQEANYKGVHVDLEQWDGCDIFIPDKWFGIVMTRKVREALLAAKITNIRFENMAERLVPCYMVRSWKKDKDS